MESIPSPTRGVETHLQRSSYGIPPPPPRNHFAQPSSPRADGHQLSPLSTVTPTAPSGIYLSPRSTTASGPSPPVQNLSSPFSASTAGPSRGVSPMAARLASYNVPYNPGDWASGQYRAAPADAGRALEDGLASPPPPYSPPSPRAQRGQQIPDRSEVQYSLPTARPGSGLSQTGQNAYPFRDAIPGSASADVNGQAQPYFAPPPQRSSITSRIPGRLKNAITPNARSNTGSGSARVRPLTVTSFSQIIDSGQGSAYAGNSSQGRNYTNEPPVAPAAIRSSSSGATFNSYHSQPGPASRSNSRTRGWQPGMPLPPPPPGAPPSASRSQSVGSNSEQNASGSETVLTYRHRKLTSTLEAIPATPANWMDEPLASARPKLPPLQVETSNLGRDAPLEIVPAPPGQSIASAIASPGDSGSTLPNSSLVRSAAVRSPSAQGLRERRSLAKQVSAQGPEVLTINTNPGGRSAVPQGCGGSGGSAQNVQSEHNNHETKDPSQTTPQLQSASQGPRPFLKQQKKPDLFGDEFVESPVPVSSTPPISPSIMAGGRSKISEKATSASSTLPSKALPTPPLSQKAPTSANSVFASTRSSISSPLVSTQEEFVVESLRRHQEFLEQEKSAGNDVERLRLFSTYIINESKIRADRYSAALVSGDLNIEEVRTSLFGEPPRTAKAAGPVASPGSTPRPKESPKLKIEPPRTDTMWWKDYQPALSPILSMSQDDEHSSRGRAPSRWWESQTGTSEGGGRQVPGRSKRESKYMGLSTALARAGFDDGERTPSSNRVPRTSVDKYPDEKSSYERLGYHDDNPRPSVSRRRHKMPASPALLDISRFVTLPPPYPRHHPAVNNSHPKLVEYRDTVRSLSDMSEVRARKSRHAISLDALRGDKQRRIQEVRQNFNTTIHAQLRDGIISYSEAAEAEKTIKMEEMQLETTNLQAEFDTLQDVVINPLHEMLNNRLSELESKMEQLKMKIVSEASTSNPDRPQEEGDETPEVLEYLTQFKWLFETREQVHKEIFDILTERNDKYKEIVVLPYQQIGNLTKARDTAAFFASDTVNRRSVFCQQSLQRHEELLAIINEYVKRGVETQSSAFWDIAPGLLDILTKIPENLDDLEGISIPQSEYNENPSYHEFPLQYLYSLLRHCEKSTYQFIESQINLHCLLHEVQSSTLAARGRASLATTEKHDGSAEQYGSEQERSDKAARLTAELQNNVSMTEEQWVQGLGSQLVATRDRVKAYLQARNGFDETFDEET